MEAGTSLDDLMLLWEQFHQRGQSLSAEELCRACPELLEKARAEIKALQDMDDLLDSRPAEATPDGQANTPENAGLGESLSTRSDYRVVRFHARGGLGEILVARDEHLERDVALKRLQPCPGHAVARQERFCREAAIMSRLEHPGIVPIYGIGTDHDGRPCYTMRFIQGETLHEAIRRLHAGDLANGIPSERSLASRQSGYDLPHGQGIRLVAVPAGISTLAC